MKTRIQAGTMIHRLFLVIGLGLLAIGPTLADIVDVTVNGSLSGSGSVGSYCLGNPPAPGCFQAFLGDSNFFESFPFSFSATTTQLGEFGASGGAWTTGDTDGANIMAFASENTTATADALEITLLQNAFTGGIVVLSNVTLNDSIAASFSLTEESKIQLNGIGFGELSSNTGELLDSKGNVILVVPSLNAISSTISTVLPPGTYQLDDSIVNSAFGNSDENVEIDLNASFTPVVPEPRWTIIATLLAGLLGGYVMSRRETVKRAGVDQSRDASGLLFPALALVLPLTCSLAFSSFDRLPSLFLFSPASRRGRLGAEETVLGHLPYSGARPHGAVVIPRFCSCASVRCSYRVHVRDPAGVANRTCGFVERRRR